MEDCNEYVNALLSSTLHYDYNKDTDNRINIMMINCNDCHYI